jgi:predicted RNA binding protein YcfA (HicA-like mRNA interferase family)
MVEGYAQAITRMLLEAGCSKMRQGRGAHEVWSSPINGRVFVVDSKILSRHTANAVLKQAGLSKRF